ncbi:hypothetical protein CPC08DRAFT_709010 [Agrocybe pediades]|nr:hypothetical protein CPC08DRAFT_709010 [Agrocybe pediades]
MSSAGRLDLSIPENIGTAFIGFLIGSVLFGIVTFQTYRYFRQYPDDPKIRKVYALSVFILHLIYFVFSATVMYTSIVNSTQAGNRRFSWAVKATQIAKTIMMLWVQGFYIRLIWIVSQNLLVDGKEMKVIRGMTGLIFGYAIVIGGAYLAYMIEVSKLFMTNSGHMQFIIYVAHASIAVIDCTIAGVLSYILYKTMGQNEDSKILNKSRTTAVIRYLSYQFIATAMLTGLTTITTVSLYVAKPSSAVCLAIDFSVPGLYANAVLNLLNAKKRLSEKMKGTIDVKVSDALFLDNFPKSSADEVPAQ